MITPERIAEYKRLSAAATRHKGYSSQDGVDYQFGQYSKVFTPDLLAAYEAQQQEIERLKARSCAVCNDTGKLDDAQGWDVGEPNSDCPYCPSAVQSLRAKVTALEGEKAREIAYTNSYIKHLGDMQLDRDRYKAEAEKSAREADLWHRNANEWAIARSKAEAELVTYKAEAERLKAQYHELVMAVGRKTAGESRHQTALRYIREAETQTSGPAMEAKR